MPIRPNLLADCGSCFGLCCVALPFARTSDFAIDKAGGEPCGNLEDDFRCGIHTRLREEGFRGCTVYDCFGAGQHVSQQTFGGTSWRQAPETASQMYAVFPVMRQLHELLWYLEEAKTLDDASDLESALDDTVRLINLGPDELECLDVEAHRAEVNVLLMRTSETVRRGLNGPEHRGADLIGVRLPDANLRGANLRGALLIAADLGGADLRRADLIGADLRDTDLRAADLTGSLFLTQSQVNAARGDGHTNLPSNLAWPNHWNARG